MFNSDKAFVATQSWTSSAIINDNILVLEEQVNNEVEENNTNEVIVTEYNPANIKLSTNILTNTVRQNFGQMFMNSLNSGDYIHDSILQSQCCTYHPQSRA